MSITANDVTPRAQYTATASQTVFAYVFSTFLEADLKVYQTLSGVDGNDIADLLTLTTHYTITGAGTTDGGNVTLVTGAAAGDIITIERDISVARSTDYQTLGDFASQSINDDLDKTTLMIQQNELAIERTFKVRRTDSTVTDFSYPAASAGQYLRWNSTATGIEAGALPIANTTGTVFDTIASLKGISSATNNDLATVYGYSVAGDDGRTDYYWDSTSTATDDGDTIIKATAITTGRWLILVGRNSNTSSVLLPTDPTAATGASGGLTGTYYYAVSYVTATGETEGSNPSAAVSPSSQRVTVTIPLSPNANVTARKIYRTPAAATDPQLSQLLATISDNTTTTYNDNIADGSLGAAIPKYNTTGGEYKENAVRRMNLSDLSTTIGNKANISNTGYANTSIGSYALNANTVGLRNTAIGVDSLLKNTTGSRNTGVGVHAGDNNVTGDDNTFVGYGTGLKVTVSDTTAIGSNALEENITGTNNTAVGAKSLQVTTGGNNTAVGRNTMVLNTSGDSNCTFGANSLDANVIGNFNCSYGMQSLTNATGTGNSAFGFQALNTTTSGTYNIGIGFQAGWWETGSQKLFIDNFKRANESDARIKAIIYGVTNTSTSFQSLAFNALFIAMPYLPTYADNATAVTASLAVGNLYKTAAGEVRIVV